MMEEVLLQVSKRDVVGKQVKTLRRDGLLPAIVYGRGISSIPISINSREANKILSAITSSNLVVIDIDGDKHTTLVREKQRDPVTGEVLHMDFYEVSMTEKLRTNVGLEFQGESPAVKELMGVLVTVMESLEVECLPQDLPNQIVADLSTLEEIGDSLYVRDISLPPNIELISDIDGLVVVISPPAVEEIEEVEEVEITDEDLAKYNQQQKAGKRKQIPFGLIIFLFMFIFGGLGRRRGGLFTALFLGSMLGGGRSSRGGSGFGGGFGGFSGGGGGFGGGGASGGW